MYKSKPHDLIKIAATNIYEFLFGIECGDAYITVVLKADSSVRYEYWNELGSCLFVVREDESECPFAFLIVRYESRIIECRRKYARLFEDDSVHVNMKQAFCKT